MKIDDYAIGYQGNDEATCLVCGSDMDFVRPGKWQCQKCELDEMLQQARREGKAEGIRLGWEQCKREAEAIIEDAEDVDSHSVYAQLGDAHRTKIRIRDAISSMEYKEAKDDE